MSLFEVIDLGDEDDQPTVIHIDDSDSDADDDCMLLDSPDTRSQTHASEDPEDIVIIDEDAASPARSETVIGDTFGSDDGSPDPDLAIFISDDESDSDDDSSDDVIFERCTSISREPERPRRPRNTASGSRKRSKKNAAVQTTDTSIDQFKINGLLLEPQVGVQLQYGTMLSDRSLLGGGYFMRIKKIFHRVEVYKDRTEMSQTWIQGPLFRRHRELDGILPKTAGEIALLREKAEVRASDVVNIREIILTNLLGRETVRKSYEDARDDVYGRLICRWKAKIKDNINGNTGMQQLGATGYIRRLAETEADPDYRASDMELSRSWRSIPDDEPDEKPAQCKSGPVEEMHRQPPAASSPSGSTITAFEKIDLEEQSIVKDTEAKPAPTPILIDDEDRVGSPSPSKSPIVFSTVIDLDEEITAVEDITRRAPSPIIIRDQDEVESEHDSKHPSNMSIIDLTTSTVEIFADSPNSCEITLVPSRPQKPRRRYTFGDAFCGAGGATSGAVMAGFKVRWGVDHDESAISAWRTNFGFSIGYQEDVHEFVSRHSKRTTHVDLLHLSPPCQFFSWARTIPGRNDEKNEASFFVVPNTLNSCRPRAVTVEETDGLIGLSRSVGHFKCMLGDFTSMGYSVKYGVLNAAVYGVPSKRKRLVIIACCPGETLADFPSPTHFYSANPFEPVPVGLRPAVTLREAIGRIPRYASDHDIEILETVAPSSLKLPPHEWDQPFRSTIKCGGGEYNLHPSRNRKFTLRELACLQSFPLDHRFHGKKGEKMRQIGNAFPPRLVGAVMESVRKHLEKTDDEWEGGGIL
ncbi:hypothetical protein Dda_3537 [Drechslerella dactyloides]|uniref:DNA (cytosine-5-)-methyltransferase n=1 Tax=Drechslerella dactyloides TaxID=74499 RepID=A0AAD6NIK1_DREDA|nr:hypothetical protein Dda_3537 [Drechslerella dactyloides]